jgi:hypothetical protein
LELVCDKLLNSKQEEDIVITELTLQRTRSDWKKSYAHMFVYQEQYIIYKYIYISSSVLVCWRQITCVIFLTYRMCERCQSSYLCCACLQMESIWGKVIQHLHHILQTQLIRRSYFLLLHALSLSLSLFVCLYDTLYICLRHR